MDRYDQQLNPVPVTIVGGGGTGGGGSGTEYAEDAAAPANPSGGILIARRRDNPSVAEVSADGDNIALNATAKGELRTSDADALAKQEQVRALLATHSGHLDGIEALLGAIATDAKLEAVRVLLAGTLSVAPSTLGRTTREYAEGSSVRQPVVAASAAFPLPGLGATREVRIVASTRTWLKFGAANVGASAAAGSMVLPADAPETIVVPQGVTHFAVMREATGADGNINLTPVA